MKRFESSMSGSEWMERLVIVSGEKAMEFVGRKAGEINKKERKEKMLQRERRKGCHRP